MLLTGFRTDLRHQYGVVDVPLRETSPSVKSEEKRMFLQAIGLQVLQRVEVSLTEFYEKGWEMRHFGLLKGPKGLGSRLHAICLS